MWCGLEMMIILVLILILIFSQNLLIIKVSNPDDENAIKCG